jgi:hypothetical protein
MIYFRSMVFKTSEEENIESYTEKGHCRAV